MIDPDMKLSDIPPETIEKGKEAIERILGSQGEQTAADSQEETPKNFDKRLCLSNIRELLKSKPNVKLGQIEKEAHCQPGYMSRLEKPDNTSEPTIEFVVTAAKLLGTRVDTLISVNLTELTPTEKYLESLFDKLITDTLADKLEWKLSRPNELNNMEANRDGITSHPLFEINTFWEETDCEYPNEVTRVTFASDSFGPATAINDDCFSLRIKNGSFIYLMDIEKSVHRVNDPRAYAREIWIYTPGTGSHILARNNDGSPLIDAVNSVFSTVKERTKHPIIKKAHQVALDAFMNDDLSDDPSNDDDLPF